MKFTDGFWHKREGVSALHPVHLQDVEAGADRLTAFAATRRINHRGDTLNAPLITVTCTSPMPDVIRVSVGHFLGSAKPYPTFALTEAPTDVRVGDHQLTSGALTVRFDTGEHWGMSFEADGRRLTGSGRKGMGIIDTAAGAHYVHEQLDLGVGEPVYGLGERFGPLVKNGQAVDIWNEDGGTSSEQAYKNVPFYLTNRGYGVLVNHPGRVSFEVGSEAVSRVQFSVAGAGARVLRHLRPDARRTSCASTPRSPAGRRCRRPGRSACGCPPRSPPTYDEATVTSFIDGMAERDLPLSRLPLRLLLDARVPLVRLRVGPAHLPRPGGHARAAARTEGLRICVWINPYIAQRSPLFAEGEAARLPA